MRGLITRRDALAAALAAPAAGALPAWAAGPAFSWDALRARALELARRPYLPPPPPPASVEHVSYDALNHISYRADRALWPGTPQEVRFFPQTHFARDQVAIAAVEGGRVRELPYSRDLFAGGTVLPTDAGGFSGFRAMRPGGTSDWLAFQGASYFRASGALDQYGLSARALAIDTGLSEPEEFPRFTRFWLERGPGAALTVYALLDSPRAAGAWRFVNRFGPDGVTQDVSLSVQLRGPVRRLGFAPLTSMFWYGEGDRAQAADWRPEIHDSDGLLMLNGRGERLWRPLANPRAALTNSFADAAPKGFGLLQRDRAFDHYQDDGVFYEKRPSLWVEPHGDWGSGAVMLVELPTDRETLDNIVAFWNPAGPLTAGRRFDLSYRLRWIGGEPLPPTLARATDVRRGQAGPPGATPIPGATRVVADFAGPTLAGLTRDIGVEADVTAMRGAILFRTAYPIVGRGAAWRLVLDLRPDGSGPLDLRATLRRGQLPLTETLLCQIG
jgi:periplasmic glucans biosynthesis protein